MLERRYPSEFSKPEVQLNVGIQNNVNGNDKKNFEIVVVEDSEFMGLRRARKPDRQLVSAFSNCPDRPQTQALTDGKRRKVAIHNRARSSSSELRKVVEKGETSKGTLCDGSKFRSPWLNMKADRPWM